MQVIPGITTLEIIGLVCAVVFILFPFVVFVIAHIIDAIVE